MSGFGDGVTVDTGQIRAHARNIEALAGRIAAVKAASAHIAQDDTAYGLLCGWIAGILEGRHVRQDELIADLERNLTMVVDRLRQTAKHYEAAESDAAESMRTIGSRLSP